MKNNLRSLSAMARRLGVKTYWLREEAEASRIPAVKAGDTFLFCADVVESELLRRARGDKRKAKPKIQKRFIDEVNNPTQTDRATSTFTKYKCAICGIRKLFSCFFGSPKDRCVCDQCQSALREITQ